MHVIMPILAFSTSVLPCSVVVLVEVPILARLAAALQLCRLCQSLPCSIAAGIVKRVVLLLLVAVIGGTVLFYAGLKFAFPDYKSIT